MKVVSYRMPDELIELIRQQQAQSNQSASALVRSAIVAAYEPTAKKTATPA